MREIAVQQGKDPTKIDSKCPADLVVDHSVQVDFSHIEKLGAKQQLQRHSESELEISWKIFDKIAFSDYTNRL